jgi:hypothetical protein
VPHGSPRLATARKTAAGFTVTESHLDMTAKIPGIDAEKFTAIANGAKAGCPSRACSMQQFSRTRNDSPENFQLPSVAAFNILAA